MPETERRVLELFSGIGGMHCAFNRKPLVALYFLLLLFVYL